MKLQGTLSGERSKLLEANQQLHEKMGDLLLQLGESCAVQSILQVSKYISS